MVEAIGAGDLRRAQDLSIELDAVCNAIMGAGQGAVYAKAALEVLGAIPHRSVRSPLVEADAEELAVLAERLRALGILTQGVS